MAITTRSINNQTPDRDNTPEYEVGIDSEGKGFLRKKKVIVETVETEEIVKKPKPKKFKKRKK